MSNKCPGCVTACTKCKTDSPDDPPGAAGPSSANPGLQMYSKDIRDRSIFMFYDDKILLGPTDLNIKDIEKKDGMDIISQLPKYLEWVFPTRRPKFNPIGLGLCESDMIKFGENRTAMDRYRRIVSSSLVWNGLGFNRSGGENARFNILYMKGWNSLLKSGPDGARTAVMEATLRSMNDMDHRPGIEHVIRAMCLWSVNHEVWKLMPKLREWIELIPNRNIRAELMNRVSLDKCEGREKESKSLHKEK